MKAELKIPGGKLIRVECSVERDIIKDIKVTGDFFMHPEEGIEDLEMALKGTRAEEDAVKGAIGTFFVQDYLIIGAKPDDFASAVVKALKSE